MSKDGHARQVAEEGITDGIDIGSWSIKQGGQTLTYSVWDFAGQTVYYNTHQVRVILYFVLHFEKYISSNPYMYHASLLLDSRKTWLRLAVLFTPLDCHGQRIRWVRTSENVKKPQSEPGFPANFPLNIKSLTQICNMYNPAKKL